MIIFPSIAIILYTFAGSIRNAHSEQDSGIITKRFTAPPRTKSIPTINVTSTTSFDNYYHPNEGYDPYWNDGQWVYMQEPSTESPVAETKKNQPPTEATPAPVLVCGDDCNYLYKRVKHVCGRQINNIALGYCYYYGTACAFVDAFITYDTYCQFLDTKCKNQDNIYNRFTFSHVGKCEEGEERVYELMYDFANPDTKYASRALYVTKLFKEMNLRRTPFGK